MFALLVIGIGLVGAGGGFVGFARTGCGDELDELFEAGGLAMAVAGASILIVREAVLRGWIA